MEGGGGFVYSRECAHHPNTKRGDTPPMLEPGPWSRTLWVESFALPLCTCGTLNKFPHYDAEHTPKSRAGHRGPPGALPTESSPQPRVGGGRGNQARGRGGDSHSTQVGGGRSRLEPGPSCLRSVRSWSPLSAAAHRGAGYAARTVLARARVQSMHVSSLIFFFPYGKGFAAF